jgi:hypothetical protein
VKCYYYTVSEETIFGLYNKLPSVDFGKLIGGPEDDLLPSLIELILKPEIQFWGYRTDSSNDIIQAKTWELFNELTLEKLSSLSI